MVYYECSDERFFKLFACCMLVKGAQRSIICDLQRNTFMFVPGSLTGLLEQSVFMKIGELKSFYKHEYDRELEDFFQKMVKDNFGFHTAMPELFPVIDLSWKSPLSVTNAVVDISEESSYDVTSALGQLDGLGCNALHLRFFSYVNAEYLHQILLSVKNSRLTSIDLFLPFGKGFQTFEEIQEMVDKHLRVTSINVHCSEKDKYLVYKSVELIFTKSLLDSELHCGNVSERYFTANVSLYTESQHHNTCLNRKISIDSEGNIKNCPSMKESYGNIRDTTLQEALEKPGFKKYWSINKDQVEVCKDCEFRYICTDCRAYLEDPENIYSKPLKCGYNPYTCEWEEWSTNPLKQKAIEYYGMQELVKKEQPKEDEAK